MSDRKEELFQLVMQKSPLIVEALDRMGLDRTLYNNRLQSEAMKTANEINRLWNEMVTNGDLE